jgi:acyl transferase domain-containing protein
VHAVITGTAVTNDGANRVGFSAPGVDGQALAITEAMGVAGIGPEDVDYVEAHGTGTALGDAVELEALNQAFAGRIRPVWLGSVKTNLGHLTWSSGIAGLIKAVLAVRNGEIPPTLHYREPNPQIDYGPFTVASHLTSWPGNAPPRPPGVFPWTPPASTAPAYVAVDPAPTARG